MRCRFRLPGLQKADQYDLTQFLDHLANDVMPELIDRLAAG
jgi:hypothetical protein